MGKQSPSLATQEVVSLDYFYFRLNSKINAGSGPRMEVVWSDHLAEGSSLLADVGGIV